MRARIFTFIMATIALIVIALPTLAAETTLPRRDEPGQFNITIGAEYSSGTYGGTTDTDIWYFPLIFRYEKDRWLFRAEVPYIFLNGPGDVQIVGGGGMGGGMTGTSATGASRSTSGIGDIIGTVSYRLQSGSANRPAIDATGKIYFGTGDASKGLGTGENSYAAQLDLYQWTGALTVYGSGGYLITGDPPGTNYRDVFFGTLGVERPFESNILGIALDAQQAYQTGGSAYTTLTGYFITRPEKTTKVTGYLLVGLSDGAPDWGIGVLYGWYY
jgi:hypothetical protein